MRHDIVVENIKCGGCVNSIRNALLALSGVSGVSIDKENATVTVEGDISRNAVVQALSRLGYPEQGRNDLLKKARSLVSCAVGRMQ